LKECGKSAPINGIKSSFFNKNKQIELEYKIKLKMRRNIGNDLLKKYGLASQCLSKIKAFDF
jgi:hypothetical protein